jgi:hypothetical protein
MAERTVPEIELKYEYKPTGKRGQRLSGPRAQKFAYDFKLQWKHVFLF